MNDAKTLECPSCGAKITANKKVCDYCGSQIKIKEEDTLPQVSQNQDLIQQQTPSYQEKTEPSSEVISSAQTKKPVSGLAIASFVLSLLGFSPVALVLGIIASAMISKPESNLGGKGFSTAAIVLSCIQIVSAIIIVIVVAVTGFAKSAGSF